jgi:hypothetical protein
VLLFRQSLRLLRSASPARSEERVLIPPHPEIVTAHVTIKVIVERALLSVFEQDAD